MSDMFEKIKSERGLLEKVASFIPGFGGYMNKESRRDADKLLREAIVARYGEQVTRLERLQTELIGSGGIEFVDDLGTAVTKLQTFTDMVKTAAYGYGGLFDAVKVGEDDLAKLYAYDNQLLENAQQVATAVNNVEASLASEGMRAACRNLITIASDSITAFERRKEVLLS